MDLDELKGFLKIETDDHSLDSILVAYQSAAEKYLANAGVIKDYTDGLYKVVVSMIVGTFLENPTLISTGVNANSLGMTLNSLIAQLRS